ncbi:hypothetical protein CSUI_009294, partial [Cystoisospora suis]
MMSSPYCGIRSTVRHKTGGVPSVGGHRRRFSPDGVSCLGAAEPRGCRPLG